MLMTNVLTLGEKMVLAARLAAAEHVRLELAEEAQREAARQAEATERDARAAVLGVPTAADEPVALTRPVPVLLGEVFRQIETHTRMPRVRGAA